MKKLAVIAAAAMLVFGFVGQAAAFFEDFTLIRTIYTTAGTTEIGSHLGQDVTTLAAPPYNTNATALPPTPEWPSATSTTEPAKPGTTPLNAFVGDLISTNLLAGGLADIRVAYYAHGQDDQDFWATGFLTTAYGGTDTDGLVMLSRRQEIADGAYNNVQNYYGGSGEATTVGNKDDVNSYWRRFNSNGVAVGSMAASLNTASREMDLSLAALLTVGYVDQLLYWFDYDDLQTGTKAGIEVAVIRTFLTSDGTTIDLEGNKIATVVNPSAVPIPGSVLLLASGLLGIFGFRRKRA